MSRDSARNHGTISTTLKITLHTLYYLKYVLDVICNYNEPADSGRIGEVNTNNRGFDTVGHICHDVKNDRLVAEIEFVSRDENFDVLYALFHLEKKIGPTGTQWGELHIEFDADLAKTKNTDYPTSVLNSEPGESANYPSSSWNDMRYIHAFGFRLLEKMWQQTMRQIAPDQELPSAYDDDARAMIDEGRFAISRTGWSAHLPTDEVQAVLHYANALFSLKIAGKGIGLGAYLGMKHTQFPKGKPKQFSDVGLESRDLYSIEFRTVSKIFDIPGMIALNIAAGPAGIKHIIRAARSQMKPMKPSVFLDDDPVSKQAWKDFRNGKIKCEAWCLERAIWILSHSKETGDRGSFSGWLMPAMLNDVTPLVVIANFTAEGYSSLIALNDKISVAWQKSSPTSIKQWAKVVAQGAGCTERSVKSRQREWKRRYGIDISFPPTLYSNLLSGIGPKDWQRTEVFAKTINSNPLELEAQVISAGDKCPVATFGRESSIFACRTVH
jgi:hypothetical protein